MKTNGLYVLDKSNPVEMFIKSNLQYGLPHITYIGGNLWGNKEDIFLL